MLVVKEMFHQSITMVLVEVVDSLMVVKVVVMVVVTEVLASTFPSQVHLLDMLVEEVVVLLFQDQPLSKGTATHGGGAGGTGNPGSTFASAIGQHATFSTGGGGGGGAGGPFPGMPSDEVQTTYGGNGAPGIVIVAYPT